MVAVKDETVGHDMAGTVGSVFQNGFTSIHQMQSADDGEQFFLRKFPVDGVEDVGIAGMTASDDDNQSVPYPDDYGRIVYQRNRVGSVLIEKISLGLMIWNKVSENFPM